ncbi:FAD/NAD(P)-binding domain-containing protein [Apiospora marii]|uniref:FAD/NAD(P)-binding domain-containing protein n=1 Tax=Apiospora marii TaxID=335849 RepID=A0ABR1R199_9PEZI
MDFTDVAIIGGAPGLTAANTVARQLHTAVVYDNGEYRNKGAKQFHMILTWDHKDPAEYRAEARKNIEANYSTVQFASSVEVAKIEKKSDSHFEVHDSSGTVTKFRKVILAVGSSNVFPSIPGYQELWGRRIFHCLFCHGYEDRGGASSGILAVGPVGGALAAHMALNAAQLTEKVTLYTNGDDAVTADVTAATASLLPSKFSVEPRQIYQLRRGNEDTDSVTVAFADGTIKTEKFLVHNPATVAQGPFTTEAGDIRADYPFWQTSVPGVYAVGDCSTPYKVTPSSITSGCNAAVAVCAELQAAKYTKPSTG